jgi:hippurate hydrolase
LGAAKHLAETRNFDGTVNFIFQPAEEGLGGARAMLADGLFERFPCDEIFGLHNSPFTPHGFLHVSPGASMAGADFFDITIRGSGGHAAAPENTRDPLVAATALTQLLQTIVSRNVAAITPAVVSVTAIHAGEAYNVIPDSATLRGTVRSLSSEVKAAIAKRIRAIAAGVATAHDVEIDVDIREVFSVLTNSEEQVEAVAAVAKKVLGPQNVSTEPRRVLGSEDFADFLKVTPGAFFTLGHHGSVPLHNPRFVVDEEIIPVGVTLFSRLVEERLPVLAA